MWIWGFCFLFKANQPARFSQNHRKKRKTHSLNLKPNDDFGTQVQKKNLVLISSNTVGGWSSPIFKLLALEKPWFASKELKKASVDLVEISGGTYETMAMMCHGWWRDWRLLFVVRFFEKNIQMMRQPPKEWDPGPAHIFFFYQPYVSIFCGWFNGLSHIIIAFVCPSTQKSGDQLVHLIKDLAGELFTIKTGTRPEYQKNYVEPAWN